MQVNRVQAAAQSQLAAMETSSQAGFQAMFEAAKQNLAGAGSSGLTSSSQSNVANALATHKTAGEELAEYESKSVAQHLRDAILKEMGLTEEQLDAMPPEQRAAIEQTIAEKIQQRLLAESSDAQSATVNPAASLLSLLTQAQAQAAISQSSEAAAALLV